VYKSPPPDSPQGGRVTRDPADRIDLTRRHGPFAELIGVGPKKIASALPGGQ